MIKKIGMVTALSTALLFGGAFQSSAHAAASSDQEPSNSNTVYYSANDNSNWFGNSDKYNLLSKYFSNYQFNWNQSNENYSKKEQPKKDQVKKEQQKQQQSTKQQAKQQPKQEKPAQQAEAPAKQPAQNQAQQSTTKLPQLSEYEQQVADLTNKERTSRGLKPLKIDLELSRVAHEKSRDMAVNDYFSHTSPVYGSPFDMMKSYGITYRTAGENIAAGQRTPEEVVNAWMNSEGHRANILNPNYTNIGVGYAAQGNQWTQHFIGK